MLTALIATLSTCLLFANSEATNDRVVAACILMEAGGEGELGMRAVASVIQNRSIKDGKCAYDVVRQRNQFASMVGRTDAQAIKYAINRWPNQWEFALYLVKKVNQKELTDVTDGAYFFQTNGTRVSKWHGDKTITIENHSFFKAKN